MRTPDDLGKARCESYRATMIINDLVEHLESSCEMECSDSPCTLDCGRLNTLSLARAYLMDHEPKEREEH
jgi:hypothetical protein